MTTTFLNTKISEVENKIPHNFKYIITQEFIMLTAKKFAARLKQADFLNKGNFDNTLTRFNKRITSNKTKHLEVQKKLIRLKTKDLFLVRIYFASNDGSQNTLVYQPTLDIRIKKNTKVLIMFWIGNQREYLILNLSHYILLS